MKRKIFCFVLSLIFALSFAACAPGESETPPDGGTDTIANPWWTTTGTLEKQDGEVVFEDVEIALTTAVCGEDLAPFNQLVAQFNAEHRGEINIVVTSLSQGTLESTVAQQIQNESNAPDLIMSHQKGHKSFAENHLIQPFDEAMEESGIEISMADYASGLASYTSLGYDGYLFGVPIDAQSMGVFYNKQLLNKYGGELPTNREELISLCGRVAAGENITPIAWSTSLEFFVDYIFPTAIVQNGGHFYDEETYYADWQSDAENLAAFKNGIASIREFVTSGLARLSTPESSALQSFLSNQALFYFGMPWNLNSVLEAYGQQNGGINVEVVKSDYVGATSVANWFAMESGTEDGNKIFGDAHFFAISRTVPDITKKAAICEFVKWFTQTGSVGAAWGEAGHVSASTIVANDSAYTGSSLVSDYIGRFFPDINYFECAGNTPYYSEMFSRLRSLFSEAMNRTSAADDESLITSAQDGLNAEIDFILM